MAEKYTLTTPIAQPSVADWEVWTLNLDWKPASRIYVRVVSNTLGTREKTYAGQDALDKLIILNKANLTNNSLHKRVLNILAGDGVLEPGTITGSPD